MKNKYAFIAILDFADDGISIEFPDFPGCYSCADNYEEAYESAEEALALHLYGMEQDNEDIPSPCSIDEINLEANQRTALIRVNMKVMRAKIENVFVKKTLTIPAYLNAWGEKNNINFSKLLQDSISNLMNDASSNNQKSDHTYKSFTAINDIQKSNVVSFSGYFCHAKEE